MTEKQPLALSLKVAEAVQDDVNKGIVRIDSKFMKEIDVKTGDIVQIEGQRKSLGIVDRAYPGDIGLNIIRMDGLIRRNAKTGIGEMVKVSKADVKEAKRIIIAPARKEIMIRASPHIFKHGLLGRAVMKGDIISLGGTRSRRSAMSASPFFDDVFSMLDESMAGFGFGDLKLVVADVNPKGSVIITESTEVEFNPEAVEVKEEEEIPEISYEDVGGLEDEIRKVREMIELPLKHPELFERLGIEPPKGVLLHGPPGTGKTLLAKAVASETNSNFFVINGPEIMSKFYGQSEANLRKIFEDAEKNAPAIIFIDEIDAIATKREESHGDVEKRVVAQLLSIMDGLKARGKVVVIAATNIPNAIDPALRRPGRFDREIEVGVPGREGRLNILKIHTRNMPWKGSFYEDIAANQYKIYLDNTSAKTSKEVKELSLNIAELEKKHDENSKTILGNIKNKLLNLKNKINGLTNLIENSKKRDKLSEIVDFFQLLHNHNLNWGKEDSRIKLLGNITPDKKEEAKKLFEEIERGLDSSQIDEIHKTIEINGLKRDQKELASVTHGFVGADLASLAKEAAMVRLRKAFPNLQSIKKDEETTISKEDIEKLQILREDFFEALKVVRPSALREVLLEKPDVSWTDIGGLEDVKQEIKEAVEWPLQHPEAFIKLGIRPPKGILLYGPPGTGKTLMARAVAKESEANFISVKGPELLVKWVGESEKAVREIFKKARQASPCIVFFDEIDSVAPSRGVADSGAGMVHDSVVNQLLTEMDGLEQMEDVIVIAATNRPDRLDTALLRPGRIDRIVLLGSPDIKAREEIFKVHTKKMPLKNVNLKELADKTEGYVGADIESVCRESAMLALRENMDAKEITSKHFEEALKKVRPSITKEIKEGYEQLKENFTSAAGKQMIEEKPAYFG
jgi:transitional endoplasmic reticulum ATPase